MNFEIAIPSAFGQKSNVSKPKLTTEQIVAAFVKNLQTLEAFYAGKKVKIAELKYGRETELVLGMEQVIPEKGKCKLTGLTFAGHNQKDDDVVVQINGKDTTCVNLTGVWTPLDRENNAPFVYSIFKL